MSTPEVNRGLAPHILRNIRLIEDRMRRRGIEIISSNPELDEYVSTIKPLTNFDNRARVNNIGHIFRVSYFDEKGKETEGETELGVRKVKRVWTEHDTIGAFIDATEHVRSAYARPSGEVAQQVQEVIGWANRTRSKIRSGILNPDELARIREETARSRVRAKTDTARKPNLKEMDRMMSMVGEKDSLGRFNQSRDEMLTLQTLVRAVEERMFGEMVHDKYETLHDEGVVLDAECKFIFTTLRDVLARIGRQSSRSSEYRRTEVQLDSFAYEFLPRITVQPYLEPALIIGLEINGGPVTGNESAQLMAMGATDIKHYFENVPLSLQPHAVRQQKAGSLITLIDRAVNPWQTTTSGEIKPLFGA